MTGSLLSPPWFRPCRMLQLLSTATDCSSLQELPELHRCCQLDPELLKSMALPSFNY